MPHHIDSHLLSGAIRIHVIGCGGTGSAVMAGLPKIHRALIALGHPEGLEVEVWDDDEVALHNCVRQNFFEADVGHPKATVMVNRLNLAHAPAQVQWRAHVARYSLKEVRYANPDFIIGCVDTKASRKAIAEVMAKTSGYWIDCGNDALSGQVVVGQGLRHRQPEAPRLPMVTELFPEIAEGEEDATPSCSTAQSIRRQGVLTNSMAALWALNWLDLALRVGTVEYSGVFFNLELGRVTSIAAEPSAWAALGYACPQEGEGG